MHLPHVPSATKVAREKRWERVCANWSEGASYFQTGKYSGYLRVIRGSLHKPVPSPDQGYQGTKALLRAVKNLKQKQTKPLQNT
jgi:hypothetical protein